VRFKADGFYNNLVIPWHPGDLPSVEKGGTSDIFRIVTWHLFGGEFSMR